MQHEALTFTVSAARNPADLQAAAALRGVAYGRHNPGLGEAVSQPDLVDRLPGTLVLIARDKASGEAVGTVRLQFSHSGALPVDHSVELPAAMSTAVRAEATRLAIAHGADARVRLALVKACWQHCVAQGVDHLLITARSAALLRIYEHLGMHPLAQDDWVTLPYVGNLPHRVRVLDLADAHAQWTQAQHPAMPFMVDTHHADIEAPVALPLAA